MPRYPHHSQPSQPYCHRKIQGYTIQRLNNFRNSLSLFIANLHFLCIGVMSYISESLIFGKHCPRYEFQFLRC